MILIPEQTDKYQAIRKDSLGFTSSDNFCCIENSEVALEKLNELVSIDLNLLEYNKMTYGCLLDEVGKIIDVIKIILLEDCLVAFLGANSGAQSWLDAKLSSYLITNHKFAKEIVGVEGPYAWRLLKDIFGYEITGLQYLRAISIELDGHDFIVMRDSISGEYGYRILMSKTALESLTTKITANENAKNKILEPLDDRLQRLLSAEVRLATLGSVFKPHSCPIANETRWLVDFNKESFLGKAELEKQVQDFEYRLVPVVFTDEVPDLSVDVTSFSVTFAGENIGYMSVIYYSPILSKQIGYAYIEKEYAYTNVDAFKVNADGLTYSITTKNSPLLTTESSNVTIS